MNAGLGLTPNRDRFVPLSNKGSVDDEPDKYVAQPRADYPMEYVCNIKCGGGEREKKTTTFLDVPPNRFGCRGDDNERTRMHVDATTTDALRLKRRRWAPRRHRLLNDPQSSPRPLEPTNHNTLRKGSPS